MTQGLGNARREHPLPGCWPGTYVPNLSEWEEGDIVLVEAAGFSGLVIRGVQAGTMNIAMLQGALWSHAAVYVGNGMVVDAAFPAGVTAQPLWNYSATRAVTVRRVGDPTVSLAMRRFIGVSATTHVGQPYSLLQAALAKLGIPSAQAPNPNALFCSTFAGLVVAEATGIRLWSDPKHQPLLPAILATHPDLDTVPVEWRNI